MKKMMKSVVMKKKMTELVVMIPFVQLQRILQNFASSQHLLKRIAADWMKKPSLKRIVADLILQNFVSFQHLLKRIVAG